MGEELRTVGDDRTDDGVLTVERVFPRLMVCLAAEETDGVVDRGAMLPVRGRARRTAPEGEVRAGVLRTDAALLEVVLRTAPGVVALGSRVAPLSADGLRAVAVRRCAPDTVVGRLVVVRTGEDTPLEGTALRPAWAVVGRALRPSEGTSVDGCRARRLPDTRAFDCWSRSRGKADRATAVRPTLRDENWSAGTTVQASARPEE